MSPTPLLPVVIPADHVSGPPQGQWTYAAYTSIPDDGNRYEIIDGVLYMAPAPSDMHQIANNWFQTYLTIHLQMKQLGRVFGAPFDVVMEPYGNAQPDVMVVLAANLGRVTPRGIVGPPDLVVEIASPSTATHDRDTKYLLYERAGVPEFWIADPHAHTVELFVLEASRYDSQGVFHGQASLPSRIVPQLPVHVEQFFA